MPSRALRTLTALLTAALVSVGAAQACPEREIEIEQEGVGIVRAATLEYEDDVGVLEEACFTLGGFVLDAPVVRTQDGTLVGADVRVSSAGFEGRAQAVTAGEDGVVVSGLRGALTLPSAELQGLPLPAGQYALFAENARFDEGTLDLGEARLVRERTGEAYLLRGARLTGDRLTASEVDVLRLRARDVRAGPGELRAGPSRIGLCADPRSRELELLARELTVTSRGTVLAGADLRLLGVRLPLPTSLALPVTARGDSLQESLGTVLTDAEAFRARVAASVPEPIVGRGRIGLRGIPLFDPYDTRVSLVAHPEFVEFGVRLNDAGTVGAFGVFEGTGGGPLPLALVERRLPAGEQYLLALRGAGGLSEGRAGYAWTLGPARLLLEGGAATQANVAAPFAHAAATTAVRRAAGPFSVTAAAALDAWRFPESSMLVASGLARAQFERDGLLAWVEHLERHVWGGAPLAALQPAPQRATTASVVLSPQLGPDGAQLRSVGWTAVYDHRAGALTRNEFGASVLLAGPALNVAPGVSYDFVPRRLTAAADVTLFSECFAYGAVLSATSEAGRTSFGARLKFGLR